MNVAHLHEILSDIIANGGEDRAVWVRDIQDNEWAFQVEFDHSGRIYLQCTMALLLLE